MEGYSADDLTVLAIEHHSMSGHPIESEQEEASTRANEEEPVRVDPGEGLGDLDEALKSHDYPATTNELVEAYGDL